MAWFLQGNEKNNRVMIEAITAILMGSGLGILLLIALVIALIVFGFKVILWVAGALLACMLIASAWYWVCRQVAKVLPKGTPLQLWFEKTGEIRENKDI